MKQLPIRYLRVLGLLLLSCTLVLAQSAELGGKWSLSEKGQNAVAFELAAKGNGWVGSGPANSGYTLTLNPAGLRNQWVGDLKLERNHSVKAQLVNKELKLTDLESQKTWSLSRQ